jgi:hypothetical protein
MHCIRCAQCVGAHGPQEVNGSAFAPAGANGAPGGPGGTASRTVPLDQIIADIAQMGFGRSEVMAAVSSLQASGKAVDLNAIIDKLTRG